MTHDFVLRTPWYVLARDGKNPFGPSAESPAIQKYASLDYIDRLLRDPRDSLVFEDEDEWSYPVATTPHPRLHKSLAYRMVRAVGMRKLYQPNHDRFYATVVELFCDEPGLPRPGDTEDLDVAFVVRRERMTVQGDRTALRRLARSLIKQLDSEQHKRDTGAPDPLDAEDLEQVAWTAGTTPLSADQEAMLAATEPAWLTEAWTVGADGRGKWTPTDPDASAKPQLIAGEQEFPMWRLPPGIGDCAAARTRCLWFGVVPTMSADIDATGAPKLDDQSVYRMRCFARLPPRADHEDCPPHYWWSGPTDPYRLASFYDPAGTKNRRVSITTPDFRALASHAGTLPSGPGGVEFVQPPGSQLQFTKTKGIPGMGTAGGDAVERCTYALELFTIVAMFLFSLFLPIVTLVFQLWWMLLLRFCWPPTGQALGIVNAYLATGGAINGMSKDQRDALDTVIGAVGATGVVVSAIPELATDNERAKQLVNSLQPKSLPGLSIPADLPEPPDPLCGP